MTPTPIKLEGAMSIAKAEGLHQQLEAALREYSCIEIDASEVSRVDTAIVQLLASFLTDAENSGVQVSWRSVSDEMKEGVRLLGMDQILSF